jgi:hypothetical protein
MCLVASVQEPDNFQILDNVSMQEWSYSTAYFNGDVLTMKIVDTKKGSEQDSYSLDSIVLVGVDAGEYVSSVLEHTKTICSEVGMASLHLNRLNNLDINLKIMTWILTWFL